MTGGNYLLSEAEIESLRQGKKRISDYIQNEFTDLATLRERSERDSHLELQSPPPQTE